MADDEDYDPNAGVAPWINIVIPIISMVIFIVAMVAVYFMPYEIAVERLDLWVCTEITLPNLCLVDSTTSLFG